MLRHYITTAIKNLLRQPLYTGINIFGLAAGLACFILIALFVYHELNFDRHWANADRIYRIARDYAATGEREEAHLDAMPAPAAPLLKQDFPQIEQVARVMCCGINGQTADGELFSESSYVDADNALFDVFDFEWISGDPATALTEPLDLVLTERTARKYFGTADPMGQSLLLQWGPPSVRQPRVVKGVIKDLPANSHLQFGMLGAMASWLAVEETAQPFADWDFNAFQTYVSLREGADVASVQNGAGDFFNRHVDPAASESTSFTATAIGDIYLGPVRANIYNNQLQPAGSMTAVLTFSAIGIFILLLACINFINLATACAVRRGREIGVRKAMGASGNGIRLQFFAESTMLVMLAVLLSLALVEVALPYFNTFMARELAVDYLGNTGVVAALVLLVLATSVIAASYPAFYLARFQATRVLRGDMTRGQGGARFRKALVTLQFSITIVLLIATAVVYAQTQFARNLERGYDSAGVLLSGVPVHPQRWEALKREWLAHPEILSATASSPTPFFQRFGPMPAEIHPGDREAAVRNMGFVMVDHDFFETYNIAPTAGRTFSSAASDRPIKQDGPRLSTTFIINELAARQLGWTPEEALGKQLQLDIPEENPESAWAGNAEGQIVGVVKDVHWEPVHRPLEPLIYRMYAEGQAGGVASIKISGNNLADTLAWIDQKWKELGPALQLRRTFLDQDYAALYEAEQRQGQMFAFFSVLALVISCLGLFGLSAFIAQGRTREIGVRKVLGGSVWSIVLLLTNDFSRLVLLSNLVAWPVAYFVMNRWLENFAYRIDLTPPTFIGSGLIALCIAWVTVGGTAAKAASAKPVLALRYE